MKNRIIEIAVTDLATTLDGARIAANDIEETAGNVYRDISDALQKTLAVLVDDDKDRTENLYQAILDGNTVTQALAVEAKAHADLLAMDAEPADD